LGPPHSTTEIVPSGGTKNDFRKLGYGGPCPPGGTHRYFFKIYALDTMLILDSSSTNSHVVAAMKGHILAAGQLMGKYKR
jgi:Raf kinase inhibitor-like YbhB/YbcL family protein